MKKYFLFIAVLAFFACKKNEEAPPVTTAPEVKTGTIKLQLQSYDSLGGILADQSGTVVYLDATHSATTNVAGEVSFEALPNGEYYLNLVRDNFEATPVKIKLTETMHQESIPFAQTVSWKAKSFSAVAVRPDSIVVNFLLEGNIPFGKQVKMALIAGSDNSLSGSNFLSVDHFYVSSNDIKNLNISKFAEFSAFVSSLDSGKVYFINVLPVSYGSYASNVLAKKVLLGDNLFPPDNWLINKEWNN